MAAIGRGHGGDGDNEDDPWGYVPPSGCKASGSRAGRRPATRGPVLDKIRRNNQQRLHVQLDSQNRTWKPVGNNVNVLTTFVGILARRVPYYYESWAKVPEHYKEAIIAEIQEFFDLDEYYDTPEGSVLHMGANNVIKGLADKAYKNAKHMFKADHVLDSRDNLLPDLWEQRPSTLSPAEWRKYITMVTGEAQLKMAAANQRAPQSRNPRTHGRRSNAQRIHEALARGENVDMIEMWRRQKTRNGQWLHDKYARQYGQLLYWGQQGQQYDPPPPPTDLQIFEFALGSRGGWRKFFGRQFGGSSSQAPDPNDGGDDSDPELLDLIEGGGGGNDSNSSDGGDDSDDGGGSDYRHLDNFYRGGGM